MRSDLSLHKVIRRTKDKDIWSLGVHPMLPNTVHCGKGLAREDRRNKRGYLSAIKLIGLYLDFLTFNSPSLPSYTFFLLDTFCWCPFYRIESSERPSSVVHVYIYPAHHLVRKGQQRSSDRQRRRDKRHRGLWRSRSESGERTVGT